MPDSAIDKFTLGRRLLTSAPRLAETVVAFHTWMIESAAAIEPKHITTVVEDGRVVAVQTLVGRFELAEEWFRADGELLARIVFYRAPTPLRKESQEIYSVRVHSEDTAHFGAGPGPDHFEWDHQRDRWMPRNMIRLAYELAVAATAPMD